MTESTKLINALAQLRSRWQSEKIKLLPNATDDILDELERKIGVSLPTNFRRIYESVGGFADWTMDGELFCLNSLQQIESFEEREGDRELFAISRHRLVFANWNLDAWHYALDLSAQSPHCGKVVMRWVETWEPVCNDIAEFFIRFAAGDPSVMPEHFSAVLMNRDPEAVSRGKKRHVLNLSLAGLPELDYFESDEKREAALAQIAKEAGRPTTRGYWSAIVLLGAGAISTMLLASWLLEFVSWPREIEKAVRLGLVILVTLIMIRRFHRQGFPAMLRQKLIEQGVPMCLKCGYNLRGQPADSTRCPECGTAINEASRRILAGKISP